ncbi:hypothetical protein ACE6H2_001084 [Prunus campanulata]
MAKRDGSGFCGWLGWRREMVLRVAWASRCWVCAWLAGSGHKGEQILGRRGSVALGVGFYHNPSIGSVVVRF